MIVFEGDGPLKWDPGAPIGDPDLNIDLAVFPEITFRKVAESRWFAFWEFAQAEIIHDPTGIAARNQALIQERMADHSEVASVWEDFIAAVKRSKKERGVAMPYGGRSGVEAHLEKLLAAKGGHQLRRGAGCHEPGKG